MIVEFSIHPMGTDHLSAVVARVIETLESSGLDYHLGPMSTSIEGSWEEVMSAVRECHRIAARDHGGVITTLVIDERLQGQRHLSDRIASVERKLGHQAKH